MSDADGANITGRDYHTADVFAATAFSGNPVAVIPDARGLADSDMQKIAREFNYSESTFVLPPRDPANTARVRIFTPGVEIPFAGHPNIGTAFVLARLGSVFGRQTTDHMIFEEDAGLVHVEIVEQDSWVAGARITVPQPLQTGPACDLDTVAACMSLSVGDIDTRHHLPHMATVGLPFVFVRLKSRDALARAVRNSGAFAEHFPLADGTDAIHAYCPRAGDTTVIDARMFDVIDEDPATGSANAALTGLLAGLDPAADLDLRIKIHQGDDMGRPGEIHTEVEKRGGELGPVKVMGHCVAVMVGRLGLPATA